MNKTALDRIVDQASYDLTHVIRAVAERGSVESELDADDYAALLTRREFKDVVIGELYESYFLPQRHEFDWQILHQIVTVVTSERLREFVAISAVSGVLGNAAFAALRAVLSRVRREMRYAKLPRKRQVPFRAMKADVASIERFFRDSPCARIATIELATSVPREKLYPLLKLLGFKHYRRKHTCYWCTPGTGSHEIAQAAERGLA